MIARRKTICYNPLMNTENLFIPMCVLVLAILLTACLLLFRRRRRHPEGEDIDRMEGLEFEYFCAELLRRRGFQGVEVTKGSGDYGIDILAEKEGVTYAIQ